MSKVAIVTDSTGCIPEALIKPFPVTVAPQILIWGDDVFEDGVDIQPREFYQRLSKAETMPSSSQVTPSKFDSIFRDLLAQDYHVLAVLISDKLSGTISSANQAKQDIGEDAPIEIMDSYTTAMAMGFQVLEAASAAQKGADLAACKAIVEDARTRCGVYLTVETLEFLHRGGRIGGASRFLGTALNIKPIMKVEEGKIEAVERVRTRKKAMARLLDLVAADIGDKAVSISTLNANALEDAANLLKEAESRFNLVQTNISDVSPVIGTHVGPGTVGIVYMVEKS